MQYLSIHRANDKTDYCCSIHIQLLIILLSFAMVNINTHSASFVLLVE